MRKKDTGFRADQTVKSCCRSMKNTVWRCLPISDAEFACVLYDAQKKKVIAARDPIGIRPLFYGYSKSGSIAFASEAKNLSDGWTRSARSRRDITI